jgi:hypothetical protein
MKRIVLAAALVAFSALSFELPVSDEGRSIDICNKYANQVAKSMIDNYKIKFKPFGEELVNGRILRVQDWDESTFYSNLGTSCALGYTYASNGVGEQNAIQWSLDAGFYDAIRKSTYGLIPGDEVKKAITDAVIFGMKSN